MAASHVHHANEQAGLEVVPEPEAPQVVEKPYQEPYNAHYAQSPDNAMYGGYQAPVSGGGYPQSSHPGSSYWTGDAATLPPTEKPHEQKMIMGLSRRKFWFIFGPLIAILVIGLAVGLGVGLGTRKSSSSSTRTTPLACPADNGTTYSTSDTTSFKVLCGVDYNVAGGAIDISNQPTSSIEDCAKLCVSTNGCAGAGWGNYQGTTICWLKSRLGQSQDAPNWFFVVKQ